MAWTTPRTFVAAAVLTAAQLNETRDNLKALLPLDAVAWTSYTPTLTQSGAVTKTVTYAKYRRLANSVQFQVVLAATGAGTANNVVTVSLPVTAATAASQTIGGGYIVDASAVLKYTGTVIVTSTTVVSMADTTQATGGVYLGQTGAAFSAPLASGDSIIVGGEYEV